MHRQPMGLSRSNTILPWDGPVVIETCGAVLDLDDKGMQLSARKKGIQLSAQKWGIQLALRNQSVDPGRVKP